MARTKKEKAHQGYLRKKANGFFEKRKQEVFDYLKSFKEGNPCPDCKKYVKGIHVWEEDIIVA